MSECQNIEMKMSALDITKVSRSKEAHKTLNSYWKAVQLEEVDLV